MTNPSDGRAVFAAMLNHVPETMQATMLVLSTSANMGEADGPRPDAQVNELVRQVTALNVAVMILENRLERSEGRAGLPETALTAILSEFRR